MSEDLKKSEVVDASETVVGEFLIVLAGKRTVKSSCSGQVIEALKRANAPLTLKAIASRVKLTKAGKALTVKDIKARTAKCARWYRDNTDFVSETDEGFILNRASL